MSSPAAQKQRLHLPRDYKQICSKMECVLAHSSVIGPEVDKQISWLQSKGLLSRNKQCPSCNQSMDMQQRSDITDQYRWRCPWSGCKKSLSLRSGTFFKQFRLQLWQWIVLMYWWAREYPVKGAAEEAEVDEKTAIQVYQYCRDVCSWRILNHDSLSYSVHQELLYKLMRVSSDTSRRTTVVGLHHERCGSSVSVTPATLLPWASCALCQIVQHRLCCLSFNRMSAVVQ